jgi:hypothetical protein
MSRVRIRPRAFVDSDPQMHHDAFMRTTISINDALLDELRQRAKQRKRPFREIVEETLQRGLGVGKPPRKPVRLITRRVGIKPAYLAQSLNQLYDQIEAEEGTVRGRR